MPEPQTVELLDLVTFRSGGTPSRANASYWNGNIPWISGKDMKSFRLNGSIEHITESAVKNGSRLAEAGTLLVLVRGMALFKGVPIGLTTCRASFNQDVKALEPNADVDPVFLAYAVAAQGHNLRSYVTTAGHGTGRLITEALETLPIWLPDLPEQRRIAAVLGAWDDTIATAEKLVAAKADRLTWLADHLAFQAIEWLTIEDVAEQISERAGSDFTQFDVFSCTKHDGLVLSEDYFTKTVYGADRTDYKVVRPLELAYATNHLEEGSIGLNTIGKPGIVSPMYTVFRVNGIDPRYLIAILKTERLRREFERRTPASVNRRGGLRWGDFAEIEIPCPDADEQLRVLNMLDCAKADLKTSQDNLSLLRTQKRGLMQKFLTGEWRVPESVVALMPGTSEVTT